MIATRICMYAVSTSDLFGHPRSLSSDNSDLKSLSWNGYSLISESWNESDFTSSWTHWFTMSR